MRYDLQIIASWIKPGAKVLDLGCGEGDLLVYLIDQKQVRGSGIERDEVKVAHCIEKGLSVLQGDINKEVYDYAAGSYDYVILSQTLQQVFEPDRLIRAMLSIGKRGIVSFPNFSHWEIRRQLLEMVNERALAVRQQYDAARANYEGYARDMGVAPASIIGQHVANAYQPKGKPKGNDGWAYLGVAK